MRLIFCCSFLALLGSANRADAFAYVFAGESNGIDVVTHVKGYFGTGGNYNITVGIDPNSANKMQMVTSVKNVIRTWNGLAGGNANLIFGGANNVPVGQYDFESVLLHEMGHSLGLAHNNLATESGLPPADRDFAKSTDGANDMFDIDDGADNVLGTNDDIRGDDVNLNYFKKDTNNPFEIAGTVDSTTYSRDLSDLPTGHNYSAVGSFDVAQTIGSVPSNTEAVMNQGTFTDEAQRTLGFDDVAGIKYAMAGLDELSGTMDDYTFSLSYAGLTTAADIVIDFDNFGMPGDMGYNGFAFSSNGGFFIGASDHVSITNNGIFFNDGTDTGNAFTWFFNDVPNAAVPEPSAMALSFIAGIGLLTSRRKRKTAIDSVSADA